MCSEWVENFKSNLDSYSFSSSNRKNSHRAIKHLFKAVQSVAEKTVDISRLHLWLLFPAKWPQRNERKSSILLTCHFPNLGIASDWMKQFVGQSVVASRDVGFFLRLSNQPCTELKDNILIFQQSFTWSTFYFPCVFVTFLIPYHVFLSLSTTFFINVCSKFWNTR